MNNQNIELLEIQLNDILVYIQAVKTELKKSLTYLKSESQIKTK